jgi:hypothetical protein
MASITITEPPAHITLPKTDNTPVAYGNDARKKPVADDYMYAFKYNFPLPIHGNDTDVLDFTEDDETNQWTIAEQFVKGLEQVIQSRDSKAFANLFLDSGKSVGFS